MMQDISFKIDCENLAPIEKLKHDIKLKSLKIGIYANNGSGKTYLSRMFRLLEGSITNFPTNDLIRFGSTTCKLNTQIFDKNNIEVENFNIIIKKDEAPIISESKYLYHTFNRDYIEDNVQNIDFEKDGEKIDGYVLGKINIDIEKETNELKELLQKKEQIEDSINKDIDKEVNEKLHSLPNVKSITEYKSINFASIVKIEDGEYNVDRTYDLALSQYNSIKSFPENLSDIDSIRVIAFDKDELYQICKRLEKPFELSSLAEEFKNKIKEKQVFVEQGLLLIAENTCPFCEQYFTDTSLDLIDKYNKYLNDTEAQIIKALILDKSHIEKLLIMILLSQDLIAKKSILFDEYTSKYILSMKDVKLDIIRDVLLKEITDNVNIILGLIEEKIENISKKQKITKPEKLLEAINQINSIVISNNKKIQELNTKKNNIKVENLEIRRLICKIVFNDLQKKNTDSIVKLVETNRAITLKNDEIKKKQEQSKLDKKDLIAKTIEKVLNAFFKGKYSLDTNTFKLSLKTNSLDKKQIKNVLSEGEKGIIAFAYYLGDVHHKIKTVTDYNRIFFVIDDPISSLDFNYVYSVCGVLKDIKSLFEHMDREKFLILTHNTEFMRVLTVNNIISKKLLLKDGKLDDYDTNFSVPYINHLHDIYSISSGMKKPNHTTANSIRHILETIVRFENCIITPSLNNYIDKHFDKEKAIYILIQDLSHGALRYDQVAIADYQFVEICKEVIRVIEKEYNGQIEFVSKVNI